MDMLLVKIFATVLALSQVTTHADNVKTQFDSVSDRAEVTQLLRDGCVHMRKAFNIENIDLDDLISTALVDSAGSVTEIKAFRGIKLDELHAAYRHFCNDEEVSNLPVNIGEVIDFYNEAVADLPDAQKLKGMRPFGLTYILDSKGTNFAELYEPENRRIWVSLSDIPVHVRAAFIAAEDKRFYQHRGIDERSIIRAFVDMLGSSGRPQGGSTITQQLTKNLLVGDDVTYKRKIREIIVASRVETVLTKDEILELYLNSIFLGRSSWGIEMAARSYFGKSAKDLSLVEGAVIAGLAKGPNAFTPDKHPYRALARLSYVLGRMQENGAIDESEMNSAANNLPQLIAYERPRRDTGYYFVEHVAREAKMIAGIESLAASSYLVRSTIRPDLQRVTETALQDGLARYEANIARAVFQGAEANLADAVRRFERSQERVKPSWQRALENSQLPLYDVHWAEAVVIDDGRGKGSSGILRVGLRDGSIVPLSMSAAARQKIRLYDLIYVSLNEDKTKDARKVIVRAELRVKPAVQGAVVVLENATGRILAMTGGFSFPSSQLNRVTQARRQPGSALKPLTYLAALNSGMQPNARVVDEPITLPPMYKSHSAKDYWTPKNYDSRSWGAMTLRSALENSKNQVTARLLAGGIAEKPADSLDRVRALATEAQLYSEPVRFYPFVLGAQPVRPLDLANFYATIANEGGRPTPYTIETIEQDGQVIYQHVPLPPQQMTNADRPAFFQLKSILQGVVARGTARSMADLSPFIAGKTGTSDAENDAWFVGFTNDVTIAVWVGYDNADRKRRTTLGSGQTGGKVAVPIFRSIVQATWDIYAPRTALNGPSIEAKRQLVATPGSGFTEYLRADKLALTARASVNANEPVRLPEPPRQALPRTNYDTEGSSANAARASAVQNPFASFNPFSVFEQMFRPQVTQPSGDRVQSRTRRIDPDYPAETRY